MDLPHEARWCSAALKFLFNNAHYRLIVAYHFTFFYSQAAALASASRPSRISTSADRYVASKGSMHLDSTPPLASSSLGLSLLCFSSHFLVCSLLYWPCRPACELSALASSHSRTSQRHGLQLPRMPVSIFSEQEAEKLEKLKEDIKQHPENHPGVKDADKKKKN